MTIYGSDVSHFDAPDTRAMFNQGIVFQTHKAGGDANDAELAAWWSMAKDYRSSVLLGAYWVLYPGSPAARADAFLARLDAQCPGWRDGPFVLQADCEKWNGDAGTVPSKAEIAAFCDRLVERMPKLRPVVYAPAWVYADRLTDLGYPLWASSYATGSGGFKALYPGDGSSKWAAYSGQVPAILQYTSSATIGGQTTCDANAYRGSLADLVALVAPGWENDVNLTDHLVDGNGKDWGSINGTLITLLQRTDAATNKQLPALSSALNGLPAALAALPAETAQQVVQTLQAGSDAEVASALKAVLGDRAAAVAALLAA